MITANYRWGLLLCKDKKCDEAEKFFRKAIELDPKSSEPWYELGNCQYNRKHEKDALVSYQKCYELDPKKANIVTYTYDAFIYVGEYEKCAKFLTKVLIDNPEDLKLIAKRAITYEKLK